MSSYAPTDLRTNKPMWKLKITRKDSATFPRWGQALAHTIDAMRSAADDMDGLDPTNCEYDEWRQALNRLRLRPPSEPFTVTDPSGNVYTVTRAE